MYFNIFDNVKINNLSLGIDKPTVTRTVHEIITGILVGIYIIVSVIYRKVSTAGGGSVVGESIVALALEDGDDLYVLRRNLDLSAG
jgi:hypothetical protein